MALFWTEVTVTLMIGIFEVIIGVITTIMLSKSGIKTKWLFYLLVWIILLSYILLEGFQAFLYVNSKYFYIVTGSFNELEA
jgi:hypothetical protein